MSKFWRLIKRLIDKLRGKDDDKPTPPAAGGGFPASVINKAREDVAGWAQTVEIANVRWASPGIRWDYVNGTGSRQKAWTRINDHGKPINGCLCALIQLDGVLHQVWLDYIRPGQPLQTLAPFTRHGNLPKPPLRGWTATSGERLGIYVTGLNGAYGGGSRERSNVVWIDYP